MGWTIDGFDNPPKSGEGFPEAIIRDENGMEIARTSHFLKSDHYHNTYKMAAAPELLEACKSAAELLHPGVIGLIGNHHGEKALLQAMETLGQLTQAVAKAKGE